MWTDLVPACVGLGSLFGMLAFGFAWALWRRAGHGSAGPRHAVQQIERQNALLGTIDLVHELFLANDPKRAFEALRDAVAQATASELVFVGELSHSADGTEFLRSHAFLADSPPAAAWYASLQADDAPVRLGPAGSVEIHDLDGTLVGLALRTGEVVISSDVPNDTRRAPAASVHPCVRNFMGLPVSNGGELVGLLAVGSSETRYTPALAASLEPLMATYGSLIRARRAELRRAEAEEQIRRLNAELERRVLERTEELKRSEADYRALFEHAHDAILIFRPGDERILEANLRACEVYGLEREQLLQLCLTEISVDAAAGRRQVAATMRQGVQVGFATMQRHRDGHVMHIEVNASVIEYRGAPAILSINRDVTARVQAEESLRTLSRAVEQTGDGIEIVDRDGTILYVNQAFGRQSGYQVSELVGQNPRLLKSGLHPAEFHAELWRTILDGRVFRGVITNRRKDGVLYQEEKTISPIRDAGGTITHFVATGRDITERLELERQLRRTETMAAMGRLVAGVAHEVRNPLFAVTAVLDAFESELGTQVGFQEYGLRLRREVARVSALMSDLLDYGVPEPVRPIVAALPPVLHAALDSCRPLAEVRHVQLSPSIDADLPELPLDPGRLAQVFINLLQNAVAFSPPGACIELRARRAEGGVECSVRDAGPGFRPEDLPRLFEPFFTRRRGGTGLGLAIAQRFVEAHGGQLSAANHPQGGAVLTLMLPVSGACPSLTVHAADPDALERRVASRLG